MHVCVHVCMHVLTCLHACTYLCSCVFVYVCMFVHRHAHIYAGCMTGLLGGNDHLRIERGWVCSNDRLPGCTCTLFRLAIAGQLLIVAFFVRARRLLSVSALKAAAAAVAAHEAWSACVEVRRGRESCREFQWTGMYAGRRWLWCKRYCIHMFSGIVAALEALVVRGRSHTRCGAHFFFVLLRTALLYVSAF